MTSRSARFLVAVTLAVCGATLVAQTPQFKSGVDLVVVDAVVLDSKGEPVSTLTVDDFMIKAGGRPRKIVSAQYVRVAQPAGGTGASSMDARIAIIPSSTSNQTPRSGRSFVIVADTNSITAGTGHLVFDGISHFIDQLNPQDLVALAVLPGGKPRVDLTADHARVREAAKLILGFSDRNRMSPMLPGEAAMIARGDRDTLATYFDRIGLPRGSNANSVLGGLIKDCREPANSRPVSASAGGVEIAPTADLSDCMMIADHALDLYRQQSNAVLEAFGAIAEAMTTIDGPKTLVLVSEGLLIDGRSGTALQAFAKKAEAARVTLYALQPQIPLMEAGSGGGPTSTSRNLDRQIGLDGLASAAVAARGAAFSITGTANFALTQIDKETSGYYLLAFERDDKDKNNERVPIDVKVNRAGFDVRARSGVTPQPTTPTAPSSSAPADPKAAIGDLIRWPLATTEIVMDADVYVTRRDPMLPNAQALVAMEFGADDAAISAIGYEVTDVKGDGVLDAFEPQPKIIARSNGRRLYVAALQLNPGVYTLKFAAIDAKGRKGSVERRFAVIPAAVDAIRISDVIFGDSSSGSLIPIATIDGQFGAMIDVLIPATQPLPNATVFLSLIDENAQLLSRNQLKLGTTPDVGRWQAAATLKATTMPPGTYVVKFELMNGDTVIAERSRRFTRR